MQQHSTNLEDVTVKLEDVTVKGPARVAFLARLALVTVGGPRMAFATSTAR
jgi:hypothetical protein